MMQCDFVDVASLEPWPDERDIRMDFLWHRHDMPERD